MNERKGSERSISGAALFALYVFVAVTIFAIGYVVVRKFY